jgi:hypothetical protein
MSTKLFLIGLLYLTADRDEWSYKDRGRNNGSESASINPVKLTEYCKKNYRINKFSPTFTNIFNNCILLAIPIAAMHFNYSCLPFKNHNCDFFN